MSVSSVQNNGQPIHPFESYPDVLEPDIDQALERLAARQAAVPKIRLRERQARLLGPQGTLAVFSGQVARQGHQAAGLADISALRGSKRIQIAEKAVAFVLGQHRRRPASDNPFIGCSRPLLCCIVFDETAPCTLAERFAAAEALRLRDGQYFSKLIATTRNTVERRIVFRGLLEHFDALLPIEQSIYPEDYRKVQQRHLDREETLYGKLELDKPVHVLLQEHSPEWVLENLCEITSPVD